MSERYKFIQFIGTDGLAHEFKHTGNTIHVIAEITDPITGYQAKVTEDGQLATVPDFSKAIPADYYLYSLSATVTLTSLVSINDRIINVVDTTGVLVGDAITFYENSNMFQSIVRAVTATTITLGSGIDADYTTGALIETGSWNMAVDGSIIPQVFYIKAPQTAGVEIHTVNLTILDSSPMDDGLFGGIPALSNGIIYRYENGVTKNLVLVFNNLGFYEIGFSPEYSAKAPAGQYGLRVRRKIPDVNGAVLYLEPGGDAQFQLIVQDDLTELNQMTSTINGHMVI